MLPPEPESFPVSSFESPVPVPDQDPDTGTLISVRYNQVWQPYVLGALKQLVLPSTWKTSDPAVLALAQQRAMSLLDMFATEAQDTEPPFWTDENDVDGEELPDNPWYDKIADWIIQAFLVITGFPEAAIIYSTSVPKIRMAFKTGNFGALFRILLNNLEIYTGDSYAPITGLTGQTLDLQAFATAHNLGPGPWELRIEHAGSGPNIPEGTTAYLEVVRKRLTDEMPIQFRQTNPCLVEYSDDGSTWHTVADLTQCEAPSVPTGTMMPFAAASIPSGWLLCNGSLINRTTYAALFAVIGTTYGAGNGSTTFGLPDLRGKAPIGAGQGTGLTNRALAATGGEELHTLSTGEMPAHQHKVRWSTGAGGSASFYAPGSALGGTDYEIDASEGGGGAHNNMQPFLALNYIIKV